ncbi:MAG TPA: OstA-like protein, partial [Anseongella sp.]
MTQLKAQDTTTTIHILESDYLVVGGERKSWIINGVFQHENATMRCDSTFLDSEANTLEAYGNVFVRQDDTITVQADRLFYDGNTRLARLFDNITMSDGQAVLTTDFLTYDMNTREGTYNNGGQIVNQDDTLVSKRGYYFVGTKDAYFRENAVVNTPEAVILSDTLHYNTGTKVANFYGPTTIEGEDDFIYAENGTYNTGTDQAQFQENAWYRSGSHLLKGNELYYDRQQNFGRAKHDVYIIDTVENIILRGELGEYNKATETAFVTDSARVIMIAEQDSKRADTIYMAADTLKTRLLPVPEIRRWIEASYQRDVLGNDVPVPDMQIPVALPATAPGVADSLATLPDSLAAALPDSLKMTLPDLPTSPVPDSLAADARTDSLVSESRHDSETDTIPKRQAYGLIGPPPLKPSDYLPAVVADSLTRALAAADSLKTLPLPDSTGDEKVDSARVLFAYNNVRVFKSDLQAIADSLVYTSLDSVMRCYRTPVVWSEDTQMSAEFMTITLRNKQIDKLR